MLDIPPCGLSFSYAGLLIGERAHALHPPELESFGPPWNAYVASTLYWWWSDFSVRPPGA